MNRDARHRPDGDPSFLTSLLRQLAGAVALVTVVTAAFWGIGQMRVGSQGPVIESPSADVSSATPSPSNGGSPDPRPEAIPSTPIGPVGTPTAAPTTAGPPTTASPEPARADPSTISLQVLDAAGDGGARSRAALQRLRDAGYRVVARNRAARRYAQGTVFYTRGHEAEARQVAGDLPGRWVVDEKPSNLSASVGVHVVVGTDYPAG
ncbi:MAG TPA: LytR C-terminal domain-containing protein [Nitriliruptorales bacterium]|nr:LytR C-terminal domain-containing protein [Nitriliruptorales bacterium]